MQNQAPTTAASGVGLATSQVQVHAAPSPIDMGIRDARAAMPEWYRRQLAVDQGWDEDQCIAAGLGGAA